MVKSLKNDFQTVISSYNTFSLFFYSKVIIKGNSFKWPNETVEARVSCHSMFSDKEGWLQEVTNPWEQVSDTEVHTSSSVVIDFHTDPRHPFAFCFSQVLSFAFLSITVPPFIS